MENAGRGIADVVRREIEGRGAAAPVAIVCGAGNNGGDGFVAARHLARAGVPVKVALTAPAAKAQGDAALMLAALERMGGVPITDGSDWVGQVVWREWLGGAGVFVDAVFGTGFHGAMKGAPAAAIAAMNAGGARRIAVDVPSGLDADSGRAEGVVFRADVTATMGAAKIGLWVDADAPVGRIEVVELGVPILVDGGGGGARTFLLDNAGVTARLPRRRLSAHKGSSGHLLVVAGSPGKTGAAVLVGQAGLRAGAGLVTVASTAPGQAALDAKVVEVMTARYAPGAEVDADEAMAELAPLLARAQAIAIGPGIPTDEGMRDLVQRLAETATQPMVLDADALNALGTDAPSVLAPAPAPRILTPHPAEMGRLAGIPASEVQADRPEVARRLAEATRAVVVLKGARTVVAAPDGRVFVNPIACPALATAGSGDVLCGVIGGFLAAGVDPLAAAQIAVYVHGRAGEALAAELGDGVAAGDLPLSVASVIARLQNRGQGGQRADDRAPTRSEPETRAREGTPHRSAPRKGARRPRRPSSPKRPPRSRR
jgi:NAD(P)H-hydrate epimerase